MSRHRNRRSVQHVVKTQEPVLLPRLRVCTDRGGHYQNLLIYGFCNKCEKAWGLATV